MKHLIRLSPFVAALYLGSPALGAENGSWYLASGQMTTDYNAAIKSWQSDPEFNGNWGLKAIQAEGAYALGYTGLGSRLGVIDQPVWTAHPAFSGNDKITFVPTHGTRTYTDPYIPVHAGDRFSYNGSIWLGGVGGVATHGTHVAGIAAASRNGGEMQGVRWSREIGQVAKVGSTERKDGPDDGQAETVLG